MSAAYPPCTDAHCSKINDHINQTCKDNGWPVNHLIPVCDFNTGECCNCTCSCLAYGTMVLVAYSEQKAIQKLRVGERVVAFNPDGSSGEKTIQFSDGTDRNSVQPEMAYVTYEVDGEERTLIATLDHTLLLADRKLARVSMLVPGSRLALASGGETTVTGFYIRAYVGGVWNIATSIGQPITSLDGHLIDTQGVLSGDFAAQLYYEELAERGQAVPPGSMPEAHTRAHDELLGAAGASVAPHLSAKPPTMSLHAFLSGTPHPAKLLAGGRPGRGGVYLHHQPEAVLELPSSTENDGYLTEAQGLELRAALPINRRSPNRLTLTQWLVTVFHAFYPDINFIIDASNRNANAYSFRLGSDDYILVQGGMLRAEPLDWQGLALVLAYSIARLRGSGAIGGDRLLCKPQADYQVVGILTQVFYPLYGDVIFDAVKQMQATFERIPTKADDPALGCHATSLDCRVATYQAAMQYLKLPSCAGGPAPDLLEVTGAEGTLEGAAVVMFDDLLDPASSLNPGNYAFEPAVKVERVEAMNGARSVSVHGCFEAGAKYVVTVSKVKSVEGYTIDPDRNTASFTMPALR